ncbi:hypothetical protein ACJ5NV_20025 [Loktanella agnita]|uniref:hypothetical protein n=1 Tax=Loktanella agnita TaxID=287097 RepID=UPI003989B393
MIKNTLKFLARLTGTLASFLTDFTIGETLVIFATFATLTFSQEPAWHAMLFTIASLMVLHAALSAIRFGSGTFLIRGRKWQQAAAALSVGTGICVTYNTMTVRYGGY